MKRSIAPALEPDARAVTLLETTRMQEDISNSWTAAGQQVEKMKDQWQRLGKPASEIAELQTIINWRMAVRDRLLAMADECDREFAALDENERDEAEQALGL